MSRLDTLKPLFQVAMGSLLAYVGLHAALSISALVTGFVAMPFLQSLATYDVISINKSGLRTALGSIEYVSFIAIALLIGMLLILFSRGRVWIAATAFVLAALLFAVDWENRGGSYFSLLRETTIWMYVGSAVVGMIVIHVFRNKRAA